MRNKHFLAPLAAIALLTAATGLQAWGPTGHRVIGQAAYTLLDPAAQARVAAILDVAGPDEAAAAIDAACNWPDVVRPTPEWAWTAPLHYVNLPRHSRHYDRERDCPDGLCVSEGVLRYAAVLARPAGDAESRWQALAFLCHLVGDLHQPLHAGFRDDRGGNRVTVEFGGEEWNLHEWWDEVLVGTRLADGDDPVGAAAAAGRALAGGAWDPRDVARWTEESHGLALDAAYPPARRIDPGFADDSWALIERQWGRAAGRLARILNALLGAGETTVIDES